MSAALCLVRSPAHSPDQHRCDHSDREHGPEQQWRCCAINRMHCQCRDIARADPDSDSRRNPLACAHAVILAAKWGGGHECLVADDALTQFDIGEQCVANGTGKISETQ